MKTLLAIAATTLVLLSAPSARAGDNVVLIELFTSQGCSSCPPADRNLALLAERDDVVALSLHVDYWDYLGWRDTFGRPEHTQRQFAYRAFLGTRVVYTPQVIVQGTWDVPGHKASAIDAAISQAREQSEPARLDLVTEDGMLKAVLAETQMPERCTVWIATYDQAQTVRIRRGENAGETITYHNVVNKLMRVGSWNGSAQSISLPQPGRGEGVAVWLQDDRDGPRSGGPLRRELKQPGVRKTPHGCRPAPRVRARTCALTFFTCRINWLASVHVRTPATRVRIWPGPLQSGKRSHSSFQGSEPPFRCVPGEDPGPRPSCVSGEVPAQGRDSSSPGWRAGGR